MFLLKSEDLLWFVNHSFISYLPYYEYPQQSEKINLQLNKGSELDFKEDLVIIYYFFSKPDLIHRIPWVLVLLFGLVQR